MDDRELLQQFVETQSEAAFTELVRRHLNLVFGTAQRVVHDAATAQDVAQAVFIKLARKAWMVRDGNALPAWLYRATYHEACNTIRRESRRRDNEAELMKFAEPDMPNESAWEKFGPLVDEALQRLSRVEQNAILLRYFEGKSLEETSAALGTTEAAARMRVNRAVEKIRRHFARGGVTITTGVLVTALTTHACKAAPGIMVSHVAQNSLAGAGAGTLAHVFWKLFAMTTQSKIIIAVVLVATVAAIPLELQRQQINQLEATASQATQRKSATTATRKAGSLAQYEAELKHILSLPGMDFFRGLFDFAGQLDAKTARALLEELAKLPPTEKNKMALSALVDRLVRLDPKGALEWANSIPNTHGREQMLGILFDTWSNIDPASALAAAQTIDKSALRQELVGEVLENMIRSNPNAVMDALPHLPGDRTTQEIYTHIFTTWGAQDPKAATTAALSLPPTHNRIQAIIGLVQGWASVDPQAALVWSDKLPPGDVRTQSVDGAIRVLAQQDPQAAANYATSLTSSTARTRLIQTVGSQWAEDDPKSAFSWLQQLNLPGRSLDDAFVSYVAGPLSKVDPQAAADYLAGMPQGGGLRMVSLMQIATNWAEEDPQADLAWLQSIPNTNRVMMITDAVANWAKNGPTAATAYVEAQPHTDANFPKMIAAVAQNQASVDVKTAMDWAQSLPEDGGRDTAVTTVLGKLSEQDPETAAGNVLAMPDSAAKTSAVQTIATNWATQDAPDAAKWVLSLPTGALHNTAATHYNSVVQQNDPATAFNVALSISDATMQSNQLNRVLGYWLKTDPAAAATAVQTVDIPDNTRNRLINTLQKGAPPPAASDPAATN